MDEIAFLQETKHAMRAATKFAKNLIVIAAMVYCAVLGFIYLRQDTLLFPAPALAEAAPQVAGLERFKVPTPDTETLDSWYFAPAPGKPLVLFLHGSGGRGARHAEIGSQFHQKGYGFLAAAFRGYAPSTGRPSETGLLTDGLALFDWAKAKCACDIVIIGHSLGSGVATHTAAEREVLALVLVSPYSSVADVAADSYWYLPVRYLIRHSFLSVEWIQKVTEPKLILHGTLDGVIPFKFGEHLFDAAPEPKKFVKYEGAGHELAWNIDLVAIVEAVLSEEL